MMMNRTLNRSQRLSLYLALASIALGLLGVRAARAALIDENFNGGTFPPTGWTVVNDIDYGAGATVTWTLNTAVPDDNYTGGDGTAAMADSLNLPWTDYDTSLISPAVLLPGSGDVDLLFLSSLEIFSGDEIADVDVTTNGGSSWSNVWTSQTTATGPESVSLNAYLAQTIQLRFRYYNLNMEPWDFYWQVDDVTVTPEPAAVLVLGLSGLAAALGRRRSPN